MTRIVVGIDGSPPADAALAFAVQEARLRQLPLRIVCAWEIAAIEYTGAAFAP
jgi:nucleotide-binding universal stress UspA family protein